MANQFYTPSPMVNFRYEPNPSDAQRLVDTMKKIKQEGQADELHEAKIKDLRQAYELSALQMQKTQLALTEEQRKIKLDQGAAEVYRTFMAGGGSRADAIRAANNFIALNGTWQDRQEADAEYIKMASDLSKVVGDTPELAGELADLLNSRSDTPIDPQVLRQRIMQRQATPLPGAPGYMIGMLEDGSIGVIDKRTEGMKKAEEFDQRIKQETLDIKKERETNQLEIARMRNEASMERLQMALAAKAQAEISKAEKEKRDMAFQQYMEIAPELAALQTANFPPDAGLTTLPAPATPAAPPVAAPATPNTSTEKKVSPAFEAYLKRQEQRKAKR